MAVLSLAILAGCVTTPPNQTHVESPVRGTNELTGDYIRIGEQLTIEFLDINPPQQIQQAVPEDGALTLLLGQKVTVVNKTVAQLQNEIHDLYVPKYYKRLTVNIKRDVRFVYVRGEVKNPSRQAHVGEMTVLKAIASAGGFTIYADKKHVEVIRSNGSRLEMNAEKARKNPKLDLPVYPDDQVNVPLRLY
jgi:protein involved in polysaccharide export with SLBB domain